MEEINQIDENGLKTGLWEFYFPNGLLASRYTYLNGVKHGSYEIFWLDDKFICYKGDYVNGVNIFDSKIFEKYKLIHKRKENYEEESWDSFISGDGLLSHFCESGKLTRRGLYKNKNPFNIWFSYSEKTNEILEKEFYL